MQSVFKRTGATPPSVGVKTSCWGSLTPAGAPRAAGTDCWSAGGSPGSGPGGDRPSTGRAASPGWTSSSPWRCVCRRRPGVPNRTAGSNDEGPAWGQERHVRFLEIQDLRVQILGLDRVEMGSSERRGHRGTDGLRGTEGQRRKGTHKDTDGQRGTEGDREREGNTIYWADIKWNKLNI